MEIIEAANLIRPAVTRPSGVWADLGAGSGTFTFALASLLGAGGIVHAVDRKDDGLTAGAAGRTGGIVDPTGETGGSCEEGMAAVVPMLADFRNSLSLPELDGVLMANSLHFVATEEQGAVLERIVNYLKPMGALVLVEYDQRRGSRWVPYPVPPRRFRELAGVVGLRPAREVGRRRSRFGPREMYAAVAVR